MARVVILLFALTLTVAILSLLLAATPASASFNDADGDGTNSLQEEVFGSDPADPASTPETEDAAIFGLSAGLLCSDGVDNDGDGAVDGSDAGCIDSDGGFPSDETELRLGSDPNDDDSYPEDSRLDAILFGQGLLLSACMNGEDDDRDGLTDAADSGCAPLDDDGDGFEDSVEKALGSDWRDGESQPEHTSVNPGSCGDAIDNDGDGAVDGDDDGCTPAPNDDRADAIVVDALPFSHTAKVIDATVEPGEPQASCSFAGDEVQRGTLWYRFTAPADMHVVADFTGSDLVSSASVWQDGPAGLEEVDCQPALLLLRRFAFHASAGETYFIQVERVDVEDAVGQGAVDLRRLSFQLDMATVPPNDDFADAAELDSLPFTASADTIGASAEPSEPDASCRFQGYPSNSIWYRITPETDTQLLASGQQSEFAVTLAAFRGTDLSGLQQVACGTQLAFQAQAGQTYYLQAAGHRCQLPEDAEGGAASICIDSRGGRLDLHVEEFTLPSCPEPHFSHPDPTGDTNALAGGGERLDITSLSVVLGGPYSCVTVDVADPLESTPLWAWLQVDTDLDRSTGSTGFPVDECGPPGLGVDFDPRSSGLDEGLLLSRSPQDGYIMSGESSFTFILPADRLGGDDALAFNVVVFNRTGHRSASSSDCAPNGGNITCVDGVCEFAPFRNGDIDCTGGPADAIDAALVLQRSAGLLASVACPDAADVNGDGRIDSLDAALILQFTAGLLDILPPPPCHGPPPIC